MNLKRLRVALLLYAALQFTPLSAAQFTTVTGTVVDPNGLPYANGSISAVLVTTATPTFTATGLAYTPPTQPAGLSLAGSFVMNLADNTQLTPGGTTWQFTVCSSGGTVMPAGGTGPVCFSLALTISGSSQDISTQLNAVALALTLNPGSGNVTGSGTSNNISKWTGLHTQGNSSIVDNGTTVTTTESISTPSVALSGGGAFSAVGPCGSLPAVTAAQSGFGFATGCVPQFNINGNGWGSVGQSFQNSDPWFPLSAPLFGVKGNTTPAVSFSDATGTTGTATLTSGSGAFATAVGGNVMTIVIDDSVEPAMISGSTVNQGTCTSASPVCIQTTAFTTGTGGAGTMGSASFPVVAYFRYAAVNGGVIGRVSKEFVAALQLSTSNALTIKSPVSTGGGPTGPNGATQYKVYASIDTVCGAPPCTGSVVTPGLASGTDLDCGTTAMGTDLVLNSIAATCTGSAPPVVPSQTTTISAVGSANSITLAANLTKTIANGYAVFGYDDTAAVQSWANALQNVGNSINQGSSGYCPPGEYLIATGPVTMMGAAKNYISIMAAGKAGGNLFSGPVTARGASCEFLNGSASADMFQVGNSASANNTGGMFARVGWRDGIPGLMPITASPVHCFKCTRIIFDNTSWTAFENTSAFVGDSVSSAVYSQFNEFLNVNATDVLYFTRWINGKQADNWLTGGVFYSSQMGGGRCISYETDGGVNASSHGWIKGTACQFFPVAYSFFDSFGVDFEGKAENTSNPAGAALIGSNATGTGALFDGTAPVSGAYTSYNNRIINADFTQFQRAATVTANSLQTQIGSVALNSNQHGIYDAGFVSDFYQMAQQVTTVPVTNTVADTAAHLLGCVQLGQGFFNSFAQDPLLHASGTYNLANALNLTFSFVIYVGSAASPCSSTSTTIASFTTTGNPSTGITNTWNLDVQCGAVTLDSTGTLICHGAPGFVTALTGNAAAATTVVDANTAASAAIDISKNVWLGVTVKKSAAGTVADTETSQLLAAR